MPRVYLDQMGVIGLGRKRLSADETEVRRRIETGQMTLVLSPTHWVDTAGGRSDQRSRELARFTDSLRPIWLRERINVHRLEVRCFLEGVPFDRLRDLVICRTVSEAVADIGGLVAGGIAIVTTENIVDHLRESRRARQVFERAYKQNARAFEENRKRYKAGAFTPEVERKLHILYLLRVAGIAEGTPAHERLQVAPPDLLRSIICEWEATKENWRQGGVMSPTRLRDLFHLTVAMPYTDIVFSQDTKMRDTMLAVSQRVPFPVAAVAGSMGELLIEADRHPDP